MSLKSVYVKLQNLKETGSSNKKIELLEEYLLGPLFKKVILLMYSENFHFNIKKLPKFSLINARGDNEDLFNKLEELAKQKGATNADKLNLSYLASVDKETYFVVKCILTKSAKAGFSHNLINKAYGSEESGSDLIYVTPYMRCLTQKNHGKNIVFPAIAQEKADGQFVNIICSNYGKKKNRKRKVVLKSRNGKVINQLGHLIKMIKAMPEKYNNQVYMGELLVRKNGKILPRKTGNGILNKCRQGTASKEDAQCVIIKLWDSAPKKDWDARNCNTRYLSRLSKVRGFVKTIDDDRFGLIKTKVVYGWEEAQKFYRKMRKLKKEGLIIKNYEGKWKDHDSPDCIKMKNISDATMRVIDWKAGTEDGKYENMMGSLKIETECGLCQVWVSGFSDKEREEDWEEYLGGLIDIEFEGIIESKSRKGIKALYLPQYVEKRGDRSEADTLEDLKKR